MTNSFSSYKKYEIDIAPIERLKRCTKCILPETFPFIEFDKDGICNYCNTYRKQKLKGEDELRLWADSQRSRGKEFDSIVSFSGGRDSSFSLHYLKKELNLNPVAFCYDWGMITDIAYRNQETMCKQLDVKLITKAANIKQKRENIQKNIIAWLKKPDMGIVPIFMAGDKHFYYYLNKVMSQYKLSNALMAVNPYEATNFKFAFCNIKPPVLKNICGIDKVEQLPISDTAKLALYYAKQFLSNPSYINSSILDTLTAALSNYIIPHDYLRLFDYIKWEEYKVDDLLINEYGWETAPDCKSSWRIGDGTAPFYNYLYYLICGFTENDTLRSNQIREGMLTREVALAYAYRDNAPRFESMKWYFDVIKLDIIEVLDVVANIKKAY